MSETTTAPTPQPDNRSRLRRLFWLVPALTFVAGLLLGGGVIAATSLGDDDDAGVSATEGQTGNPATTSPAPEGDRTITVPASCVDGLDRAEEAVEVAESGLGALRDLDTARLQSIFEQLQQLRPEITRLADACRAAATDGD